MFWFSFFSTDTLSTINKDTKVGVIRRHKLKDRKYNGQKKKDKLRSTNHYTEK